MEELEKPRGGVIGRVTSSLGSLKGALREVAHYVLHHPGEIVGLSTGEIARITGTSEAAAVRLAQRLGYTGFRELQINLAYDLGRKATLLRQEIETNDDVTTTADKIQAAYVDALSDSRQMLDTAALEQAIELVVAAHRLILIGQGANTAQVADLHYNLSKLGLSPVVHTDPYMQAMAASVARPGDLFIGISHTGANRDLIESFLIARSYGAKTICLTMQTDTPLTRISDITLAAAPREIVFGGEPFTSRISLLYLVDLLFIGVGMRLREASENLRRVQEGLRSKRYPYDGPLPEPDEG